MEIALELLKGGAGSLAAYLAAHVLLCLLPAFFIAGAMAALIPKASITRWLGRSTPAHVSYPAAAAAGSLLAVCSCTIVPLFAGIGPAITFLFAEQASVGPAAIRLLLPLVAVLIAGTLKLWPLTGTFLSISLPLSWAADWQATLFGWVPFDATKGEEGVSLQGSVLIALLLLIAATAWKGLENIIEGPNRWTWVTLGLAATTLLVAALRLIPVAGGLEIGLTGRVLAVAASLWACWHFARQLDADDRQAWLWESWRFVKQIFLLLVAGVFIVGMVRQLIKPEWIESLAGSNTLQANAVAVFFGVFMYFPTLVEVPVARMFLDLGMHPGPLLAYLMADPELSLQSRLMVAADFVKVTDMQAIMAYDLLSTPGLVLNDKLVSSGRIPTVAEVQGWLAGA